MITPAYAPTATERVLPRLALDFTTGTLDPRVTVTRALNTATAVNSSGNIAIVNANLPRFDYDPVTLLPKGILIEESRVNIAVYSNDVTGTGWTLGGLTTSTPTTSPDGTANAVLLLEDNSTGFHRAFQVPTTTAAAWTVSGYFKPNGRDWIWLRMSDSGGIKYAWFNITTGVTGTVQSGLTANIFPAKNGFYRCTITAATAAAGAAAVIFGTADADNSNSFAGDITKGIYFYGFQIELGAFATSYIPNLTTGTTTRNADVVSMTGTNFSDWYNATEGTFYSEFDVIAAANAGGAVIFMATDGTKNGYAIYKGSSSSSISTIVGTNTSVIGSVTVNDVQKAILGYNSTNIRSGLNRNGLFTTATASVGTLSRLNLGRSWYAGEFMSGHIRKINYWPQKLTDAELTANIY